MKMAVESVYECTDEIVLPDFPGPLMRSEMEKEDLIQYIKWKMKQCLIVIDHPEKVEEYFFWKIMEFSFLQNGSVTMCEIAVILFQSYSFLKNLTEEETEWKDWLLPLALLLWSNTPHDEHREAIIKMGDDLESSNLTYPAHICYVIAKVELGMRRGFELIGCHSVPYGLTGFYQAFKRTETYEYLLSLTSGHAQPNFQSYKLSHASRTAFMYSPNIAFKYCETIARSALVFPDEVNRSFIERVLLLTDELRVKKLHLEEPDWLREFHLLLKIKLASTANSSERIYLSYPEEKIPQTSDEKIFETKDSDCLMVATERCDEESSDVNWSDIQKDVYESRYSKGELLRKGMFYELHAGVRIADGKKVTIKSLEKDKHDECNFLGKINHLPFEVEVMKIVCNPPQCDHVLELLEWFDIGSEYIMILDDLSPFCNLWDFIDDGAGYVPEDQARNIMQQVVQAAHHCCERFIVFLNIEPENILIHPETLEIKLIDFVHDDLCQDSPFNEYPDDVLIIPPEWYMDHDYLGVPGIVWGLGVLLFNLLTGEHPFHTEEHLDCTHQALDVEVSQDCVELMMWCLEFIPKSRPSLEDLLRHEWFTRAGPGQSPDSS